jgi:fatty acid desaturase
MSISKSGFSLWKEGNALRNALIFISSFMFERIMLIMNDFVVAIAGRNFFFPNKPKEFHDECARYCRSAVLFRLALCFAGRSFKPLLYLYFAETLWSIPPHPASAMFITNHPSKTESDGSCVPSSSTYAGRWYSLFTLGTNFHVEHHDFPTIPLHLLWKLRRIAPEFYKDIGDRDNIFQIMRKTFQKPDFYACMNSNNIQSIAP